jgi:hypothetical protein
VNKAPLRIALFTLESLASSAAVRAFVEAHAAELVLIGRSKPYRAAAGGAFGQFWRHLCRSGLRFLPYLFVNFALPSLVARLRGQHGLAGIARTRGIGMAGSSLEALDQLWDEVKAAERAQKAAAAAP